MEILVVLLVAFILLGPQRMVEAARFLGKAVREVSRMSTELVDLALDEDENNPASAPTSEGGGANADESDAVKKADREHAGARASERPSHTRLSAETDETRVDSNGPVAFRPPSAAATEDDAMPPPQ